MTSIETMRVTPSFERDILASCSTLETFVQSVYNGGVDINTAISQSKPFASFVGKQLLIKLQRMLADKEEAPTTQVIGFRPGGAHQAVMFASNIAERMRYMVSHRGHVVSPSTFTQACLIRSMIDSSPFEAKDFLLVGPMYEAKLEHPELRVCAPYGDAAAINDIADARKVVPYSPDNYTMNLCETNVEGVKEMLIDGFQNGMGLSFIVDTLNDVTLRVGDNVLCNFFIPFDAELYRKICLYDSGVHVSEPDGYMRESRMEYRIADGRLRFRDAERRVLSYDVGEYRAMIEMTQIDVCIDGKNRTVIIENNGTVGELMLRKIGFNVLSVDTTEHGYEHFPSSLQTGLRDDHVIISAVIGRGAVGVRKEVSVSETLLKQVVGHIMRERPDTGVALHERVMRIFNAYANTFVVNNSFRVSRPQLDVDELTALTIYVTETCYNKNFEATQLLKRYQSKILRDNGMTNWDIFRAALAAPVIVTSAYFVTQVSPTAIMVALKAMPKVAAWLASRSEFEWSVAEVVYILGKLMLTDMWDSIVVYFLKQFTDFMVYTPVLVSLNEQEHIQPVGSDRIKWRKGISLIGRDLSADDVGCVNDGHDSYHTDARGMHFDEQGVKYRKISSSYLRGPKKRIFKKITYDSIVDRELSSEFVSIDGRSYCLVGSAYKKLYRISGMNIMSFCADPGGDTEAFNMVTRKYERFRMTHYVSSDEAPYPYVSWQGPHAVCVSPAGVTNATDDDVDFNTGFSTTFIPALECDEIEEGVYYYDACCLVRKDVHVEYISFLDAFHVEMRGRTYFVDRKLMRFAVDMLLKSEYVFGRVSRRWQRKCNYTLAVVKSAVSMLSHVNDARRGIKRLCRLGIMAMDQRAEDVDIDDQCMEFITWIDDVFEGMSTGDDFSETTEFTVETAVETLDEMKIRFDAMIHCDDSVVTNDGAEVEK